MKLNVFKSALLLILVSIASSCSDDYLVEEPQGRRISTDQIAQISQVDPSILDGTLRGLYALMYTPNAGRTAGEDDFGHKSLDLFSDLLSADMALNGTVYGWYSGFTNFDATINFASNPNYMVWRYLYRVVLAANTVIDGLGGNEFTAFTNDEARHSMGQAKAMRAYAYFYLVQLLSPDFDKSAKIIPIYDSLEDFNMPQSTTGEVFDFIIKDLTEGIDLLEGFSRPNPGAINQDIAKSLLAYTYASLGDKNVEAMNLAKEVMDAGYPLVPYSEALGGFNDINKTPWMWGTDIIADMQIGIQSWWGAADLFTYGYPSVGDSKTIDINLYNKINDNDIRKEQFISPTHPWYRFFGATSWKKFYDPNRVIDGQFTITTDYVYMRVEEMYLLYAEMAAKEGFETEAKDALKVILAERFENASDYAYLDALTDSDLLDEIDFQTRLELWGEGKSYLNMKRNKKTVTRGANHLLLEGESFLYSDSKLSFLVPQTEVQNNPNIN